MLKTKNLISTVEEVPNTWPFEYYLSLPEALTGQDVKIKSVFSSADTNPSLFVYFSRNQNKYKFKDFSSGKQGDSVELVQSLYNLAERYEAVNKIINDYIKFIGEKGVIVNPFTYRARFKLSHYKVRKWNKGDAQFWLAPKIGSNLLKQYNVKPLDHFILTKEDNSKSITIRNAKMYGYFKKDGTLYKIYQPLMKDNKFFKVVDHIQGWDQLTFTKPYLIIGSSLKDIMATTLLAFNADVIAPDSENIIIQERVINYLKTRYKAICTMFDNDAAGIAAMKKYKELYDLPYAHIKLEKDTADNVETHGIENTKIISYPVLTQALLGITKEI